MTTVLEARAWPSTAFGICSTWFLPRMFLSNTFVFQVALKSRIPTNTVLFDSASDLFLLISPQDSEFIMSFKPPR